MEKRKVVKTDQAAAVNMMECLPQDIIVDILSRLPVTSLVQSQLVCKAWRSLIQDPFLVGQHHSRMVDSDQCFILEGSFPWSGRYQLYVTDFSNHNQGKVVLYEPDNFILYKSLVYIDHNSGKLVINYPDSSVLKSLEDSCNGLLCMRDSRGIYIYNPFTRLSMEIPKITIESFANLQFDFHPITKEYKLIQIVPYEQSGIGNGPNGSTLAQSKVHVLTISRPDWRNLGMIPYHFCKQNSKTSKAMVNGRLHWICVRSNRLVSFDLATEQFQEVPKPNCCGSDGACVHHIVVVRGCLSACVRHDDEKLEIWVMKEYGMKESWVKEFNIMTQRMQQEDPQSIIDTRSGFPNFVFRVISILKGGEILIESRTELFVYHPHKGTFRKLKVPGKLMWFRTFVHVDSLNWLDTPVNFKTADK